jgi:rfaE bifunctional protein kinase chain/domain
MAGCIGDGIARRGNAQRNLSKVNAVRPGGTVEESRWLEEVLNRLPKLRIAVFGDFCLDGYWPLDTENVELSIETGLPVRRVLSQRYSLGGGGNVVANLVNLGAGRVQAIGIVGADVFGRELLRLLSCCGADVDHGMISDAEWQTMVYAKPFSGNAEQSRFDFGAFNSPSEKTSNALLAALRSAAADNDVIILNQQIPCGVSPPHIIEKINDIIAGNRNTQFVVDSRHRPELYRGAVLKLNAREAMRYLGIDGEDSISGQRAQELARQISRKSGKPAFLTRGENGIVFADGENAGQIPGIQILTTTDPVGAGDTVVAAIAAALGAGETPAAAARLANIAAMVTVQKLQVTGTATPAEILAVGAAPDYIYEPELADTPQLARYLVSTEIEEIGAIPADLHIEHCIFDHDGTISTLRQGWEEIMEPMMVQAVLGSHYKAAGVDEITKVARGVRGFIDRTTGVQTLVQMKGLVELVRNGGFVEEKEILTEHEYKKIFNEDLLKMVGKRMKKVAAGELGPEDFQIKNAVLLLQTLHQRDVHLYLASGTDEADVVAEATALGYADLFEGKIFGAVGDIKVEAKKVVLERIFRENHLGGHQLATFGDGPVEIRETRKHGGFCVGIASDEVRRFGWNFAKRSRLVRAGATLIVPDFSQLPALLNVMRLA